jgi:hypothetical protein
MDEPHHRRIRTLSRKAREVLMQNDELTRRLPVLAPTVSRGDVDTAGSHTTQRLPALAPALLSQSDTQSLANTGTDTMTGMDLDLDHHSTRRIHTFPRRRVLI